MKMPQLLRVRNSLANRITWWVVLYVVVIITIAFFVGNYFMVKSVIREEKLKADGVLYIVGQRIEATLFSVETAVRNHLTDIKDNLDSPNALYRITRRMLEDNPNIVGSAIAFSPHYFPEKGLWFSPYSYRDGDTIRSKQLGSPDYNYHAKDWYHTTDSLRRAYWSEPYFDDGGGEMLMTTYCFPLTDDAGNLMAVVTADILLNDLSALSDVNYYEKAYSFIVSRNGIFISHPKKELVLRQSVFSIAEDTDQRELMETGQDMIEGKSGMRKWKSPTLGDSYIFYVPLHHTGWSIAIVCKTTEFFKSFGGTALFLMALFVVVLALLANILRRAVHRLIAPLTAFTYAVDEVTQGNLQSALPVIQSKDEMLRLCHSFSAMQQSLISQMDELKKVNEAKGRIEGELQVAREIQLSMLPREYQHSGHGVLDIYGQLIPANEVGGDLYDFFVRDGKLFFAIGDVSGKGVPSALVMAVTLSLFRNLSSHEDDLEKIISSINKTACGGNDSSMFTTFFAGVLDLASGLLHYCNAGHNKPLIVSDSVSELAAKPDLPLGVSDEATYMVGEYAVPSGAMLFLYTDGLTEARNEQHELFGMRRVLEQLESGASGEDCKSMVEKMPLAVHRFAGNAPQSDDLTMLAIRF